MNELLGIILGSSTWPARDAVYLILLAFNAIITWRIMTNHLPHIDEKLGKLSERIAHLEGKTED